MDWRSWFDVGYGLPEWKRDRHVLWSSFLGWCIWALPQIPKLLEGDTSRLVDLRHNFYVVMTGALAGVITNWIGNNDKANASHVDDRLPVTKAILPGEDKK